MKKISLLCSLFYLTILSLNAQVPQIDGTVSTPSCAGEMDGAITLLVTGGQPPYLFAWGHGPTTNDISGLSAGQYFVTVSDALSATNTASFVLTDPTDLVGGIVSVESIQCSGGTDGEVLVAGAGGTPPYSYEWSSTDVGPVVLNLPADNYVVTITDANNCTYEFGFVLGEPSPIQITNTQLYECESGTGNNGELTVFTNGGTPPYLYRWSDGFNTNNASRNNLPYGTYSVTVEDANACTQIVNGLSVCHSSMVLPENNTLCQFGEVELFTSAPGALGYSWSPVSDLSCTNCNAPIASPTISTLYTVTITTPSGMQYVHEVNVAIDEKCIWPGDIDSSGLVSHFDLLPIGLAFDVMGPTRYLASNDWTGQTALPWPDVIPSTSINLKHVDADGDGTIDEGDKIPLDLNWEESINFTNTISPYPNIPLLDTLPFYISIDSLQEGETITFPVILGMEDLPGEEIYGIAFSIDYDSSLFVPGTALLTFEDSWLGEEGTDMITIQKEFSIPGRLDAAMVRTNGQNTGGFGSIASYTITVEDDILFTSDPGSSLDGSTVASNSLEVNFVISNVRLINKDGFEMTPHMPIQTAVLTANTTGRKELPVFEDLFQVFPNPAQEKLWIHSKKHRIDYLELYNASGMMIQANSIEDLYEIETDVSTIPNGAYWVRLKSKGQVFTGKVLILR